MIDRQTAEGTLGDDALDRNELADKLNALLGRNKFHA